jgi:RNA polymerase sigma-70 factor (sigma-E family)
VQLAWPADFEEFAAADTPRLLRIARVLTGNDHDAADLVQDCLSRMGMRWGNPRKISNPHAYARATLVNLNISRVRRFSRELLVHTVPEHETGTMSAGDGLDPWLDLALKRLPRRQRAAVALAYLEDQSVTDIAEVLGCSVSAAKTHLARGRAALQRAASARSSEPDDEPIAEGAKARRR